ncbi:T9SS type B sorting domain-containing protein [Gramella lutea]|uniref:T9SS type B sorting domain-containing protein n=1 Tax=Christiangramia lutea TaxID=1607951 RepID=A0A9X2AA60_9FLAO|nr:T9SS type B sorting domain-containing protein [Christiangramia lutea]MCH4824065.1 T9SS type B sorting domain-containing protein [Christiangramia lutea]
MKTILFLLSGFLSSNFGFAQGALCSDIEPFCAGEERLTFPNSNFTNSNQLNGELGPDYGCLDEQPYPAWFFLQIEEAGDLTFRISQYENPNGTGAPLDVDFVVWGPFERGDEYCNSNALSADKIIDCSYLPDAVETMRIPDAEANSIYVVVITNFEQVPGFISLEQTNTGQGGSTDCSILQLDLGDSISVCDESEYVLDGTTDEASSYEWFIFNENSQEYEAIPGENGPTLTVTESANYKLIVTDDIEDKSEEDDVTVTFYNSPSIGEVSSLAVCDLESDTIDLTENFNDLIQPNEGDDYEVLYYESSADVTDGNFISQPEIYPFEEGKIIYAEIIDMESGCTSPVEDFELKIFDFPDLGLDETTIFCVTRNQVLLEPVEVGDDLGEDYSYEWYIDETLISSDPVVDFQDLPSGTSLRAEVTHAESGCQVSFNTLIAPVSAPENVLIDISGSDFGDGYTVTAEPENFIGGEFAEFEFRLDNGTWQDSNVFNQVKPGNHTVTAREINGCGATTSENFFLVGYPRFFTPNSDGYNDNWNLITDSNISIKTLYVFDRYGKLITRVDPDNKGWDGTYNGQDLPADDYWFRVEFIDEKTGRHQEYISNFTLMRSR